MVDVIMIISFSIILFLLYRKLTDIERKMRRFEKAIKEISVEVIASKISQSDEDFQSIISSLSERLLEMIKEKYGLEGVMTLEEMKKRVLSKDIPEEEKMDLAQFLDYLMYMEYSPKGMDRELREKMKNVVSRILRRLGEEG